MDPTQTPVTPAASSSEGEPSTHQLPLCVDLDGTLIRSDSLHESLLLLARQRPGDLLRLPLWLARGKAFFKEQIAQRAVPEASALPYCDELVEFLRAQKAAGRTLVLATASNWRTAKAVADHLGIFDQVLGSDAQTNLAGPGKLAALESKYGPRGFDYIGNSRTDLPLWSSCRGIYVCNASAAVARAASQHGQPRRIFARSTSPWRGVVKALRPLQWTKNALLFIPLALAHRASEPTRLLATMLALVAFCLCASAVYLTNDLLDIEADRHHPRKRTRPFAAGTLSITAGLGLILLLLGGALGAALGCDAMRRALDAGAAPLLFTATIAIYFAASTSYSFYFKRKLLLDVILLAGLYTLRIISGSVAACVPLTVWLLAFSMFMFLSLAFAKRYSELVIAESAEQKSLKGRSYLVEDLHVIESVGPTSGYLAVLVMGLYLNTELVRSLYHHPQVLWLACPVFLYWITRIWFLARRRALVDDPVVFALTDRVSWMAGAVMLLVVAAASL